MAGYPGSRGNVELQDLLSRRFNGTPWALTVINELNGVAKDTRVLVITDINTSFVYALTTGERKVTPLTPDFRAFPYRYTEEDRARHFEWALAGGAIYAVVVETAVDTIPIIYPAPAGFEWRTVFARDDKMAVAELRRIPF